jgi:hypothetical protein
VSVQAPAGRVSSRNPALRRLLSHPLGLSRWQFNYWRRKGYIKTDGSYTTPIPPEVEAGLLDMCRLFRAGFTTSRAAELSQEGTVGPGGRRVIPAGPGVTVILDPIE